MTDLRDPTFLKGLIFNFVTQNVGSVTQNVGRGLGLQVPLVSTSQKKSKKSKLLLASPITADPGSKIEQKIEQAAAAGRR
jgi:hypothetical protein